MRVWVDLVKFIFSFKIMIDANDNVAERIDMLSYVALRMHMYFNTEKIALGTAFIYLYDKQPYLITNWHNISGREPSNLKAKHSKCALPNKISLEVPLVTYSTPDKIFLEVPLVSLKQETYSITWEEHPVSLYRDNDDSPTETVWYEHPQHGYNVDVIAIPLYDEIFSPLKSIWYISNTQTNIIPRETALCAVNDPHIGFQEVLLLPSLDVFVLGFPKGMSGGEGFPVWKRGSIASEPELNIDNLPKLLIDTATREGMSGAPVFVQERGYWLSEEKDRFGNFKKGQGEGRRFIGIYSGRLGDDEFQAQLGIVWKASVIEEIIRSSTKGKSSFDLFPH